MGRSSQTHFPRPNKKRRYRTEKEIEEANMRAFKQAAWEQRACAVTGDTADVMEDGSKGWEAHHVVEKRWLKANFKPLWDWRNALRLRPDVHGQHTTRMKPVPLRCLTDENIQFAFEVMGYMAYDYLTRLYTGDDPRVEAAFEEVKAR